MQEYLLISKGNQTKWKGLTPEQKNSLEKSFEIWVKKLTAKGRWVRGNGLPPRSLVVRTDEDAIVVEEGLFSKLDSAFTGVFIIRAINPVEATEIAKECPTLQFDEIFVFELNDSGLFGHLTN